mmetsp:Transcript_17975/g.41438  ORF Transcript_17975/g.41438 Transcript_17975/m.41438 type:complete len:797 (-) Transcript_17975:121-2511(-)
MNLSLSIFLFATIIVVVTADLRGRRHRWETVDDEDGIRRRLMPAGTECVTYVRLMDLADGSDDTSWVCRFDADTAKEFDDTTMMELGGIGETLEAAGAVSGATLLRIGSSSYVHRVFVPNNNGATVSPILFLAGDADFEIEMMDADNDARHYRNRQRHRRRLAKGTSGEMSVLVVRTIDGNNMETQLNQAQLDNDVFQDASCLASRYAECSHGELTMIKDDIIDLKISEVASGQYYKDAEYGIRNATIDRYGSIEDMYNAVDLVVYCQPPGSYMLDPQGNQQDWVAYAYINGFESFYNDEWCGYVSAQVHEVGHNLGLAHSGIMGMGSYDDTSGMMGYSYRSDDGPLICFNSAKSYQLRWFEDKVASIDPQNLPGGSQSFDLVGVADYGTADGLVSLRLEYEGHQYSGREWYVGYNRKDGINSGVPDTTQAMPDTVHILEKTSTLASEYEYGESRRIAALSANEAYSWDIGGVPVSLRVDFIDGAIASVTISGGNAPSEPPTLPPIPVVPPSLPPTRPPTLPPTVPTDTVPVTLPSSPPTLPPTVPTDTVPISMPTPYPTSPGECTTSTELFDGRPGVLFELEVKLDEKSGSEFGWNLVNDLTGDGWWGADNFDYPNGDLSRYVICLPKFECFTLTLADTGGDGISGNNGEGYYKGYVEGEEVFSGGEWTGTERTEAICIGREHCKSPGKGFRYVKKKGKASKKARCKDVDKERGGRRKKFCKYSVEGSGRKKVQQVCTESCGEVGLGPCGFLQTYGDEVAAAAAVQPAITESGAKAGPKVIRIDPVTDNIFSHLP